MVLRAFRKPHKARLAISWILREERSKLELHACKERCVSKQLMYAVLRPFRQCSLGHARKCSSITDAREAHFRHWLTA